MKRTRFTVRNVTKGQLKDQKTLEHFERLYSKFTAVRSEIIDAALWVENTLTVFILHALIGEDYSRHKLLRAFVFEAEFCSFMQKRKILSMLFEEFSTQITCINTAESKVLRREINEIIETRNIFAHGHIVVDAKADKVFIEHYQSGPKETEIADSIVNDFLQKCERSNKALSDLNKFIRKIRLELA